MFVFIGIILNAVVMLSDATLSYQHCKLKEFKGVGLYKNINCDTYKYLYKYDKNK